MAQYYSRSNNRSVLVGTDYQAWNQAIADYFYHPTFADRPVYLQIDEDVLLEIARHIGVKPERAALFFKSAIRLQIDRHRKNPFASILSDTNRWIQKLKRNPVMPPPFLALLGICVLAASKMSPDPEHGISGGNYYVHLNELLGFNETGAPPCFDEVTELWPLLNEWLAEYNHGKLGLPTAETHSHFKNIGYPISQSLLRNSDRQKLPDFFRWEGLESGDLLELDEIIPRLQLWTSLTTCTLNNHGQAIFRHGSKTLVRQAAQVVLNELKLWDGGAIDTEGRRYAKMELRVDRQRRGRKYRFSCALYPRAPHDFPEGDYIMPVGCNTANGAIVPLIRLPIKRWFSPLPNQFVEQALADGLVIRQANYTLQFDPSPIMPLEEHPELGGWVSRSRVNLGEPYLVLCRQEYQAALEQYLKKYAESGWSLVKAATGLPPSWSCFHKVRILSLATAELGVLAPLVPRLRVGISLMDGLKIERGVWLEGGAPNALIATRKNQPIVVSVDGKQVAEFPTGTGKVALQELNLNCGEHEILAGTQRRKFRLCASGKCPNRSSHTYLGYPINYDTNKLTPSSITPIIAPSEKKIIPTQLLIVGATIRGLSGEEELPRQESLFVPLGYKRYIVLGKRLGDVMEFTINSYPYWWHEKGAPLKQKRIEVPFTPQWLIKIGKKRRKTISAIGFPEAPEAIAVSDEEKISSWVRWAKKRYMNLKKWPKIKEVWEQYRAVAQSVGKEN